MMGEIDVDLRVQLSFPETCHEWSLKVVAMSRVGGVCCEDEVWKRHLVFVLLILAQ